VTLAVFLATLTASIAYTFLTSATEDKYEKTATFLNHIFFGNLILLFLILPTYLITSSLFGANGVAFTGIFHGILVALLTQFVLEILSARKHLLVNLYGTLIGLLGFYFCFSLFLGGNPTVLSFLTLPLVFACMGAGNGGAEVFYNWLYRTYGFDFLNIETQFGEDYADSELPGEDNL
jgi:hypothetical protein